jgi:hypothetical protein
MSGDISDWDFHLNENLGYCMRFLSRYGSNAARAELVMPDLDGRPELASAQDLPGDLHLQVAQAAEPERPVHRQFYIQPARQGLIGAEEDAFRADIVGLADASVQNLSAMDQFVLQIQLDGIPLMQTAVGGQAIGRSTSGA